MNNDDLLLEYLEEIKNSFNEKSFAEGLHISLGTHFDWGITEPPVWDRTPFGKAVLSSTTMYQIEKEIGQAQETYGHILGFPVIESEYIPDGEVLLVDTGVRPSLRIEPTWERKLSVEFPVNWRESFGLYPQNKPTTVGCPTDVIQIPRLQTWQMQIILLVIMVIIMMLVS
jgi:hypothetical protein